MAVRRSKTDPYLCLFWVPYRRIDNNRRSAQPVWAYSKKQAIFLFYKRQEIRWGTHRYRCLW